MPTCYDGFMSQRMSKSEEGFTLLELLVIAGAVIILTTLVLVFR